VVPEGIPEIPVRADPVQQPADARHRLESPSAFRSGEGRPAKPRSSSPGGGGGQGRPTVSPAERLLQGRSKSRSRSSGIASAVSGSRGRRGACGRRVGRLDCDLCWG
jgi:hypothetical protein